MEQKRKRRKAQSRTSVFVLYYEVRLQEWQAHHLTFGDRQAPDSVLLHSSYLSSPIFSLYMYTVLKKNAGVIINC